jgi:uncharacterized protein
VIDKKRRKLVIAYLMENNMRQWILAFKALALGLFLSTSSVHATEPVKVVYHMSEGIPQASRGLNNIRNHLAADPSAKIVVVTHGLGIDFLLQGATNQMEQPFAGAISDLANRGVEFRVCNNTLVSRKLEADKLVMEAKVVPSGVAEVATMQAKHGFVYLRP